MPSVGTPISSTARSQCGAPSSSTLQPEVVAPPPLDARWAVTFASVPAATPGYDATSAYIPLKGGQLVAVNLERGTTRWTIEQVTAFRPATGEGLVFTVSEQMIQALDA